MDQKYTNSLPLYRQEQQFSRLGIELSRQTIANWLLAAADPWLKIIYAQLHEQLLEKDILHALNTFLLDGRLEIDNNRAECSIKPFVIGRKNFLFSNTPRGARGSAIIYSIIETAKENNLKPYNYLMYLFEMLPNIDASDQAAIGSLMPWSDSLPEECSMPRQ